MDSTQKWFLSSTGSGNLSLTLQGMISAFIPMFVIVLAHFGVPVTESVLVDIVTAIWGGISAFMVAYGLIRKLLIGMRSNL